jgi:predicted GIY-YIG superfamily endonuclease
LRAFGTVTRSPAMLKPEWMKRAEAAARSLRATTVGQARAGHSVYVILLQDPSRGERWGLYVGQTSRDPDVRFDQHKAGYKASGAVRRFGVRLLPELVAHLNPMRQWEAIDLEAALAEAFRQAGVPWVEGGH